MNKHTAMTRVSRGAMLLLLVLISFPAAAQKRQFVYSSPKGMYVFCGTAIGSAEHPAADTIGYRIERKTGKKPWARIADVSSVTTWDALRARVGDTLLARIARFMKAPSPEAIWDSILAKPSLARVPFISSLDAMLALGTMYLDASVTVGTRYEYRVSTLLRSGAAVKPRASAPVAFGEKWAIGCMKVLKTEEDDSSVAIEWWTPEVKPWPQRFLAYRRFSGQEDYTLLPKTPGLTKRHDTLVCALYDKNLRRNQEYEYYVVPEDFVENRGPESQVATIYTLNFTRLPLPQNLRARPDPMGIRLTWATTGYDYVMSTRIYRSMHFDSGFVRIAELPSTDTGYLDASARGMIRYYYRMTNVAYRNHESQKSNTVFSYWRNAVPPATPQVVRARPVERGVEITWATSPERDIAGYYVYRMQAISDSIGEVISPLLETNRWLDTSATLRGTREYRYAVVALSTSQARSGRSVEVRARPIIATSPLPPRRISAHADGERILVAWNDPREYDESVVGYVVYRLAKGRGETKEKEIGRIRNDPERLWWMDSTVVPGAAYVYAVAALDMFGYEGIRSAGAEGIVRLTLPEPPSPIHVSKSGGVVTVEWDKVYDSTIVSFAVYRNERGKAPEKIGTLPAKERRFTDRKVRQGTAYYYAVASVNAKGREGKASAVVYVVP